MCKGLTTITFIFAWRAKCQILPLKRCIRVRKLHSFVSGCDASIQPAACDAGIYPAACYNVIGLP